MSRIGNERIAVQETEDYLWGWESAERGEPIPGMCASSSSFYDRRKTQRLGWQDYHNQVQQP